MPDSGDGGEKRSSSTKGFLASTELEKLYKTVRLMDMDVLGDGNCFLYAAMGINGRGADNPRAAADLRRRAIAHARSLPATVQDFLDLRRATVDPADPCGNNGTTWSMSEMAEKSVPLQPRSSSTDFRIAGFRRWRRWREKSVPLQPRSSCNCRRRAPKALAGCAVC
jgi:hypothetical protein